jgi:4-oxalocrotonate tautomerase family enzyme
MTMPTVIIYWSPGRSDNQKQAVAEKITDALVDEGNANRNDVLIIFQNIEAGDAARGGIISGSTSTKVDPNQ